MITLEQFFIFDFFQTKTIPDQDYCRKYFNKTELPYIFYSVARGANTFTRFLSMILST